MLYNLEKLSDTTKFWYLEPDLYPFITDIVEASHEHLFKKHIIPAKVVSH